MKVVFYSFVLRMLRRECVGNVARLKHETQSETQFVQEGRAGHIIYTEVLGCFLDSILRTAEDSRYNEMLKELTR